MRASRPLVRPIAVRPGDMFAQDSRVTFAFRLDPGTPLTGRETIEIATTTGDGVARIVPGGGYDLQDATTGIVSFVPREALGASVHGPLRFRILRAAGDASRWAALGSAIRLPDVQTIACTPAKVCTVTGSRLFLIEAIAANDRFDAAQAIPDGYTDGAVDVPLTAPVEAGGALYLRLRDAADATGVVPVPPRGP